MGARSGGGLAQPRGREDGGSRLRSLPLIQPRRAGTADGGGHPAWWVQSLFPGLGAGKRGISRIRSFAAGFVQGRGLIPSHTHRWGLLSAPGGEPQRRLSIKTRFIKTHCGDFPGSPVVKTSPSRTGHAGSIPGQGAKVT